VRHRDRNEESGLGVCSSNCIGADLSVMSGFCNSGETFVFVML
jgi:hypothetical protein